MQILVNKQRMNKSGEKLDDKHNTNQMHKLVLFLTATMYYTKHNNGLFQYNSQNCV